MKTTLPLALVLAVGTTVSLMAGQAPFNAHEHQVSRLRPFVSSSFIIVQVESIPVLDTRPDNPLDRFKAGSGKVIECRRHPAGLWDTTVNTEDLHQARCVPIPPGSVSHVICMGVFKPRPPKNKPGGGGPGNGDALEDHLNKESTWRSQLVEPGVHVIVANQYRRANDQTPTAGYGLNRNQVFYFAGMALEQIYAAAGDGRVPDRVVFLTCGLGGTIDQIFGLPTYLRGLDPPVEDGTVITYDTIGHGIRNDLTGNYKNGPGQPDTKMPLGTLRALRAARPGQDEADWVCKLTELQPFVPEINQTETAHGLDAETDYAPLIGPFLKEHAVVTLAHCYTGEDYDLKDLNDPDGPATERPSVASQVNAGLQENVTVIGFMGNCATGVSLVKDVNLNGLYDKSDGDLIRGVPYYSIGAGATVDNSNQVNP